MAHRRRASVPEGAGPLDPTNDVVFRRFFGDPEAEDLLIALLTAVLRPSAPIRRATSLPTVRPGLHVHDKEVVLDLLVELDDGRQVDVEMQCARTHHLIERVAVYWSRTLASALRRGGSYSAVRPAMFVGILGYVHFEDDPFHCIFEVRETTTRRRLTELFEAHFVQLPLLPSAIALDESASSRQDPLVRWSRFFIARSEAEREELAQGDPIMRRAKDRLSELATDRLLRLAAQKRADDRVIIAMSERRALAESRAEGVAAGRAEGVAAGRAEAEAILRTVLVHLLESRFGTLGASAHERIVAAPASELERWISGALTAPDLAFLERPNG